MRNHPPQDTTPPAAGGGAGIVLAALPASHVAALTAAAARLNIPVSTVADATPPAAGTLWLHGQAFEGLLRLNGIPPGNRPLLVGVFGAEDAAGDTERLIRAGAAGAIRLPAGKDHLEALLCQLLGQGPRLPHPGERTPAEPSQERPETV